jgi:hypothetical protein
VFTVVPQVVATQLLARVLPLAEQATPVVAVMSAAGQVVVTQLLLAEPGTGTQTFWMGVFVVTMSPGQLVVT